MVVTSAPTPGHEDAYNAFYASQHIPDLLRSVPGLTDAQRYHVAAAQSAVVVSAPPAPYLAIYAIEVDDLAAVVAAFDEAAGSGAWAPFPSGVVAPEFSLTFYDAV
jgi:hypothetical protein